MRLELESRFGLRIALLPRRTPESGRHDKLGSPEEDLTAGTLSTETRGTCARYRRGGTRLRWPNARGVNRARLARCFVSKSANDDASSAPDRPRRITGENLGFGPCGLPLKISSSSRAVGTARLGRPFPAIHGESKDRRAKTRVHGFPRHAFRREIGASARGVRAREPERTILTQGRGLRSPFPGEDHPVSFAPSTSRSGPRVATPTFRSQPRCESREPAISIAWTPRSSALDVSLHSMNACEHASRSRIPSDLALRASTLR